MSILLRQTDRQTDWGGKPKANIIEADGREPNIQHQHITQAEEMQEETENPI